MKIYTNTYDLAMPSANKFWVAPNSDFKIGIKVELRGQAYSGSFTLKQNGQTVTADEDKTAGFTTYTIKSGGPGSVIYTVDVPDAQQKFTLVQIVTDSTVFDVGGSGGGDVPADVATKSWVESQISDFVEEDALTAYATVDSLSGYAQTDDLTAYYTKTETSSAAELSDAFASAGGGISIREALDNGICLPQTIFENADGTFGSLDLSGEVDFTEGRIGTGASILSNAVRVNIGTNISAFTGRAFGWTGNLTSLVIPESVTRFNTYETFSGSKLDSISATIKIPDSVTVFGTGSMLWNSRQITIDFGDTRKTIPSTSNIGSLTPGDTVYVPDSLYSTWIASANWQSPGNTKILPRSAMTAAQKVGKSTTGQAPIVNTVHSVYETDWETLSATADANTFYVVLPDPA